MLVDDELEAWPQEHVRGVDVAFDGRNFAALELKGKVLIKADAEQDAKGIRGGIDELFGE